jgi:hypothetical protein
MGKKIHRSKTEITPEGFALSDGMIFAYAHKQAPDGRDCHIYLRRDLNAGIDTIISDMGDGMFSFVRDGAQDFPMSIYKESGYGICSESDFNDVFIEAVRYIIRTKPQRKKNKNDNTAK